VGSATGAKPGPAPAKGLRHVTYMHLPVNPRPRPVTTVGGSATESRADSSAHVGVGAARDARLVVFSRGNP